MNPISPNRTSNNSNSFNRQSANRTSNYSARREPVRQSMTSSNMNQPQGGSSMVPSITSSYQRIAGGTPTITVSNAGPKLKSKTESALERYEADRAVRDAEEREKEEKSPFYRILKEQQKIGEEAALATWNQKKQEAEMIKKYGMPSDYQRGFAQAQEQKAASERASNYMYGLQVGREGFKYPG